MYALKHLLINIFMNKSELITAIASESGLSKIDSKKALDAFISSVSSNLKSGDKIVLVGFGTFSVANRKERTGINPATQKTIKIPAKKVVKFKAGSELADGVK
jgi:DNA-binding protein HU-beta